jgi:hypothetical protein
VTAQVNGAQATQTVTVAETLPTVTINAIDNGLINAAAAAGGVALSGSVTGLAANSTFQVTLSDGAFSKSYTATVNSAGTGWTATVPAADATTLADGTATATAQVTDQYGNVSTQAMRTTAVHETPPLAPAFDLSKADQTGPAGSHETSSAVVTLVGQTGAGDTVLLTSTGQTTIANTSGAFQFTNVNLAQGANALTVQATDATGNTSRYSLTIDRLAPTGSADAAVRWNQIALQAIKTNASDPDFASRALAMESLAVFDAVSAIDGTPGYLLNMTAPADADANVAAAQAAHDVLTYLFPAQKATFDAALASALGAIPDGQGKTDGIALGAAVAAQIIALRANDGWNANVIDDGSTAVGQWRPTAPSYMPALDPQWASVTPFALTSPSQFLPPGPPDLASQAYADAVNLTESLGAANSTTRTADQTQIANFWKDGAGTYTPPGEWNSIADQVAQAQGDSLAADARLFAELNVALADSAIAAWNTKFDYNTWRPITVIQDASSFTNAGIIQDPNWQPLIITPNFPEYVSGHSTFSAAAAEVLSSFFGNNYAFDTGSSSLPGVTRNYSSFWDAANEAGMSRIYGGIHFSFSNTDGLALGTQVGDWTLQAFNQSTDTVPPKIVLNQTSGFVTNQNPTITGVVNDNLSGVLSLQAQLDSTSVMDVSFNPDGTFSVPVTLPFDGSADGKHIITFTAIDAAGNAATPLAFNFTLATKAPQITLASTSIQDGGTVAASSHVTGAVTLETGDSLTSLFYTFDGATKMPISFDATTGAFDQALDLTHIGAGNHTLTLNATDAAGNITTDTLNISLPSLPLLTIADLTPMMGESDVGVTYRPKITFSRPINPTTLTSNSFYATDSTGTVVPATIVPFSDNTGGWLFFNNPLPGASTITLHVQGDQIKGTDSTFLDASGTGMAGSDLTESFTTVSTATVPGTTITGIVVDPGPDGVPMTPDDVKAAPDGLADYANDTWKLPIAGVKVYVLGNEDQAVYTDATGHFTLTNVPSGDVKVEFDGTTATNAPAGFYFPVMVMDTNIRAGVANTIMGSMGRTDQQLANAADPSLYLPRLHTDILSNVSNSTGGTVTLNPDAALGLTAEQQEQLTLQVAPGSLIGENGQPLSNAQIGISMVAPSLVDTMLPEGLTGVTATMTIQAPGVARFATPVTATFPNVYNAAPGTQLDFFFL